MFLTPPRIFQQVQDHSLLRGLLEGIRECTQQLDDEDILPHETRRLLQTAADITRQALDVAQSTCQKSTARLHPGGPSNKTGAGDRIIWVLKAGPQASARKAGGV